MDERRRTSWTVPGLTLLMASTVTMAAVFDDNMKWSTVGALQPRPVIIVNTTTWWTKPLDKFSPQQSAAVRNDRDMEDMLPPENNETRSDGIWSESSRVRRDVLGPYYLEVLLVTDNTVIDFHGEDLIHQYLYTQLRLVNDVYHHPSLGAEFNIQVVGLERFNDAQRSRTITPNDGRASLQRFCQWVENEKITRRENTFDIALYITKERIEPAGYAPVTGMCKPSRSCAIVRDDGFTSSFIIAHEIGHIIGMNHDGYMNRCPRDPRDGKLMGSTVKSSFIEYYWSDCSRNAVQTYKADLHCLENRRNDITWPEFEEPFGLSWSLDEQCRQEFGDDYTLCRSMPPDMDPCEAVWCGRDEDEPYCRTKGSPPLQGTPCGRGRWCMDGRCSPRNTAVVHGGWSEWYEWSDCSVTCGVGVQYRSRACDNPWPQNGGRTCSGEPDEMRVCNTQDCPEAADVRADLCAEQNDVNFYGQLRHNWLPLEYDLEDRLCYLACVSEETGDEIISDYPVRDGTFCSYDNKNGICARGHCQEVGCDFELSSGAREDRCGVCEGDGTTCTEVTANVNMDIPLHEYHSLIVLPAGTRHLHVEETNHYEDAFFIAVRDMDSGRWYLNGNAEKSHTSYNFVLQGSLFHYVDRSAVETLDTMGPLLHQVEILIFSKSASRATDISYSYTVGLDVDVGVLNPDVGVLNPEVDEADGERYIWQEDGWSECSVTCGGGSKGQMYVCMDQTLGVSAAGMCDRSTQNHKSAPCNEFSCVPYRWEITGWEEECSATCGPHGVQHAHVVCLYRAPNAEEERVMRSRYCQHLAPPTDTRTCNDVACVGEWSDGPWSACSVTCGEGQRTREVICAPDHECPSAKPSTTTSCSMPSCPIATTTLSTTTSTQAMTSPTPSTLSTTTSTQAMTSPTPSSSPNCRDRSPSYCGRFASSRRCKISRFRRACCATCQQRRF